MSGAVPQQQDAFYPRLIIEEYFDTLRSQLDQEVDNYLACQCKRVESQTHYKDVDHLNLVRKQLVDEINRLKQANLTSYNKHANSFLISLDDIRRDRSMCEEKKINVIYKLLFSSGYCFFIDANQVSKIKRLVVLDCFPNNNSIYDNSKDGYPRFFTDLNEEWVVSYLISLELENIYSDNRLANTKYIYRIEKSDLFKKQKLNLSKFHFTKIDPNTFTNWKCLRKLDLSGNQIEEIRTGTFRELSELEELYLSCNKIRSLEKGCFSNLTSLRVLNLAYNKLEGVNECDLADLVTLEELNLASNSIKHVHPNGLIYMRNLRKLNLSYNLIESLDEGVFRSQTSLLELLLNNNQLALLPSFKSLAKLKKLGLSKNCLLKFPSQQHFDDLANLEELNLSFIDFKQPIEWKHFQSLSRLKSLAIFKFKLEINRDKLLMFSKIKDFRKDLDTFDKKTVKILRQSFK